MLVRKTITIKCPQPYSMVLGIVYSTFYVLKFTSPTDNWLFERPEEPFGGHIWIRRRSYTSVVVLV